tara:strand:- start:254 stop:511 length:258 start_codon:yes stop_codon:yes gene_type:complete
MEMIDDGESDFKIIAVPVEDRRFEDVHDLEGLNKHQLKEFKHFFETYKELKEKEVTVTINKISGKNEAIEAIKKSIELYKEKYGN